MDTRSLRANTLNLKSATGHYPHVLIAFIAKGQHSGTQSTTKLIELCCCLYTHSPIINPGIAFRVTSIIFLLGVTDNVSHWTFPPLKPQLIFCFPPADLRVRPVIMAVKKWARHHQINDASKGTLSSYTLVLMVLHYLQS